MLIKIKIKGKNKDEQLNYGLGYSTSTNFSTNLFAGPSYDQFQMSIYVQVYDNNGAFTMYEIATLVQVVPDLNNLELTMDKLISGGPVFATNIILNQGSYLNSIQIIQTISSLLNFESFSDKFGINVNKSLIFFPQIFGPMASYSGLNVVNVYSHLNLKINSKNKLII